MDEDWFEDAVLQAVLGREDDFFCGKVELDVVTAKPWYPEYERVLTLFGDEHRDVFLVLLDPQADLGNVGNGS